MVLQLLALLFMLGAAVITDLRERRIPNKVTVSGLCAGLVIGAFLEGGFPLDALGGAGLALIVAFTVHIFGGFGAGDAKLLTAVGAFVGPGGLLPVVIYGAVVGGVFALIDAVSRGAILGVLLNVKNLVLYWITRARKGHRINLNSPNAHTFPYGVAIAAGAVLAWVFPFSLLGMK
jgi:prepilin peptidase CpaA